MSAVVHLAPSMVIIGAGQAGARAAHALRDEGWDGPIVLIGDELHLPYDRPPLSKGALLGTSSFDESRLYGRDFFDDNNIEILLGTRVVGIERAARRVRLSNGSTISYGRLLLATGAAPRRLQVPGADIPGIVTLRDLTDARVLAARLRPGSRLLVIGGGLIGLEVAAAAVARGAAVQVVESAPRLLMRAVPQRIAALIAARHEAEGVALTFGKSVTAFEGNGSLAGVVLSDGSRIGCDLALIAIGAAPRTELASDAALAVENGVVVDANLRTEDPCIFAAGDVCSFHHATRNQQIRLEHWQNAEDQARHAARSMMGVKDAYIPLPWFWSEQYDLEIQSAGFLSDGVSEVARQDASGGLFLFHRDSLGRLVAVSGIGRRGTVARTLRLGRMMLERGMDLPDEVLADPGSNLKARLR